MDAREVYAASLVWDDHCGFSPEPDEPLEPLLAPWREAGVGYLSVNVYFDPQPWEHAERTLESLRRRLPTEAPWCRLVSSVAEIDRARADGKLAVGFDIEGMNALDGSLDLLRLHHELEPSTQQRGPLFRRTRPPARQRRIRGFDRAARLRRPALRDLGNRLARRRIAHGQRVATVRVGPFTIDVCPGFEESLV